jgi:hypothetical protein
MSRGLFYDVNQKPGRIIEAGCWAHARRKLFGLADIALKARRGKPSTMSPIAFEAVQKFDAIFAHAINGATAEQRLTVGRKDIALNISWQNIGQNDDGTLCPFGAVIVLDVQASAEKINRTIRDGDQTRHAPSYCALAGRSASRAFSVARYIPMSNHVRCARTCICEASISRVVYGLGSAVMGGLSK